MTTKDELVRLVDDFVNDYGMWQQWKRFVKDRGYTLEELGFEDDDDNDEGE